MNIHNLKIEGKKIRREIIEQTDGAVILAFDGTKVILINQNHFPQGKLLEIPGGKIEKNETPRKAASREFEEETGYKVKNMKQLVTIYPNVGYSTLTIHCFVSTKVEKIKKPKSKDDDEFIEVVKINFEKLLQLIKNGKILDGKTIAAVLMYESKFLEKQKKYSSRKIVMK